MKRFKIMLLVMLCGVTGLGAFGLGTMATASAKAAPSPLVADLRSDACNGLDQIDSSDGCGSNGSGINKILKAVINILGIIIGIAAIIMVIVSGLKFVTSGGDSAKVSSAKSTLVYALVGLILAALAQVMVHFVLGQSSQSACPSDSSKVISDQTCIDPATKKPY